MPHYDEVDGDDRQPTSHSPTHPPLVDNDNIIDSSAVPYNSTAHPESAAERLRAARRYSRGRASHHSASPSTSTTHSFDPQRPPPGYASTESVSHEGPPPPPLHRDSQGRVWGREVGYSPSSQSLVTPMEDNQGPKSSRAHNAGITGVAMSVADARQRESGIEAMRNTPTHDPRDLYPYDDVFARPVLRQDMSSTSLTPFGNAGLSPGMQTPNSRSTTSGARSLNSENPYSDNAFPISTRHSRNLEDLDPSIGFDPDSIADDGDDGLHYGQQAKRVSMLSLDHSTDRLAGGAPAKTGMMAALGGLVGRKGSGDHYDPANAHVAPGATDYPQEGEKGTLAARVAQKKRKKWCILITGAIILAAIVAAAIAAGIIASRNNSDGSKSGDSASSDTAKNGDLNKDSSEIQALLNNNKLHKVFPGIDYTPMNTQYPDCLKDPPSPNNITRDLAVLSQMTNTIRLYGTDCNQTEMLMHSIDQLDLKDNIKVWLGVWIDNNDTTNTRQLEQLYKILDNYDAKPFLGVIVGNEVLYRKDKSETELAAIIDDVRSNLTSRSISIPVASSDLGDNWTAELASKVDYVMANIHPFFAGVTADVAASWTWNFWQTHDTAFTTDASKNVISETGWPSQGGTDCGGADTCTDGAVAGIDEMNKFMDTWVCQALANSTNYFWFEAFDEPWKLKYDTAGKNWEDHWGVLTADRVLKDGVEIPDCGGKTVA